MNLKMTTAQVVETSVTVTKSPFQNYTHPDDHTTRTTDTPGFKPFTMYSNCYHCYTTTIFIALENVQQKSSLIIDFVNLNKEGQQSDSCSWTKNLWMSMHKICTGLIAKNCRPLVHKKMRQNGTKQKQP